MPGVLIFDVNETLLDLRALDPHFTHIFGDAGARAQWFGQFIQNALLHSFRRCTILNQERPRLERSLQQIVRERPADYWPSAIIIMLV